MNEQIGLRWQPGSDTKIGDPQTGPSTPTGGGGPASLLSFRLPTRQSPTSIAPNSLTGAAGGGGVQGLQSFLRMLEALLKQGGSPSGLASAQFPGLQVPAGQGLMASAGSAPPPPRIGIGLTRPTEDDGGFEFDPTFNPAPLPPAPQGGPQQVDPGTRVAQPRPTPGPAPLPPVYNWDPTTPGPSGGYD